MNFHFIEKYIENGHLPTFRKILDKCALQQTISEKKFHQIEPWIQWPTFYTGKGYSEHGLFRLGDSVNAQHAQVWETLENAGKTVGAISPMNAANRCRNARFFVPDPWTVTDVTGSDDLKTIYQIVRNAVNENAHGGGLGKKDLVTLALALVRNAPFASYPKYLRFANMSRKYKWAKALFLDQLLTDLFVALWAQEKPDYASLFLNATAHIQHHHMYESSVYEGPHRNPTWYSRSAGDAVDPLLVAYSAYDNILKGILELPGSPRILITTGLSQVPNKVMKYQYRFISHDATVSRLGVEGAHVVPRMSRDFLLEFESDAAASAAEPVLARYTCAGKPLFETDNRGSDLFCKICYFGPPDELSNISDGDRTFSLKDEMVLVSIENGIHQTVGYHIDTAMEKAATQPAPVPLASLHDKILHAMLEEVPPAAQSAA